MRFVVGVGLLVTGLVVSLLGVSPSAEAKEEKAQLQALTEPQAIAVAEKLAAEVLPGSKPVLEAAAADRTEFTLGGEAIRIQPKPRLYLQGSRVGTFSDPEAIVGQAGEYTVPQLAVALAYLDKSREVVRCGYAVLEPAGDDSELLFRGVKRFALGGAEDSFLCGVIRGIQDKRGGIGKEAGDGLDEVLVESYVVDKRADAEKPPVLKVTNLVDLGGAEPRLLEQVSSEPVEKVPGDVPVYLEYSGADKVRLVANYPKEEERIELPPELASIGARFPALVVKSVRHSGSRTAIAVTLPTQFEVASFLREMEKLEIQAIVPESITADGTRMLFYVSYAPGPPKEVPKK